MLRNTLRTTVAALIWLGINAPTCAPAQTPAAPVPDVFQALHFLEGSWTAHGAGQGATSDGSYSFRRELNGHVLARHGQEASCTASGSLDCDHHDLLYVYPEGSAGSLKAIYFDNEGHTIHYDVTTPEPNEVVFLSEPAGPGPRFRLMYALKGGVLAGKFQMQVPGQSAWHSYLEWSGHAQ